MADDAEIEAKFWKTLEAAPTMILGVAGARDGHGQPMTALFKDRHSPLWFFTTTDNSLVESLNQSDRAMAHYVSKGHDVFATLHGSLSVERSREIIDELWNAQIAQWYPGGRDDSKLCVLRLDAESAQIWLNASNFAAGIKRLFGSDPKQDYKDKVAEVAL